jgi:hypothetical protein
MSLIGIPGGTRERAKAAKQTSEHKAAKAKQRK